MVSHLRFFSFGGGWQSMAALVLAAQGELDYQTFLFANVGNDSEHPDTLRYIEAVAKPYAAAHGLELCEVRPTRRGEVVSLYQDVLREDAKAVPIPMRDAAGAPGVRACTKHYKVIPIARETKRRGATVAAPAVIGLGISLDELERMNSSRIAWQVFEYPLIDRRLTRQDCGNIIERAGLPIPPKSACWFCPFLHYARWREMKEREPSLFMNAVVFERDILAKQRRNGKPPVYFTRHGRTLDAQFSGEQAMMDLDNDTCESGFCMT